MSQRNIGTKLNHRDPPALSPIAGFGMLFHKVLDSLPSKIVGLAASILTVGVVINSYLPQGPVPPRPLPAPGPQSIEGSRVPAPTVLRSSHAQVRSITQTSFGSRSPNISGVGGEVGIKYDLSTDARPSRNSSSAGIPSSSPHPHSASQTSHAPQSPNVSGDSTSQTSQTSYGSQSPNIDGGGNVRIEYGGPVRPDQRSSEPLK